MLQTFEDFQLELFSQVYCNSHATSILDHGVDDETLENLRVGVYSSGVSNIIAVSGRLWGENFECVSQQSISQKHNDTPGMHGFTPNVLIFSSNSSPRFTSPIMWIYSRSVHTSLALWSHIANG